FREQPEGLGFNINVGGPISRLIPSQFRDFFGADTRLRAAGVSRDAGGLLLSSLTLTSAALSLEAAAETASDGFLTALSLDASIADPQQERVLLPVAGADTTLQSAQLSATYGEAGSDAWRVGLNVSDLRTGEFAARDATLQVNGQAQNLSDPANRRLTYDLDGALTGISAANEAIEEALGETVRLESNGSWQSGQPLTLANLQLAAHSFVASLSGAVQDFAINGNVALEAADIAPFSGLAGRAVSGGLTFSAEGELRPISGAFNLDLDGTGNELRIGEPAADALLEGSTRLTGRIARTEQGFEADNFRIANEQLELDANGTFATEAADFRFNAAITDLALLTDRASGRLNASGTAQGSASDLNLNFSAGVPSGRLLDRNLTEAQLTFNGHMREGDIDGRVTGDAFLDGTRASLQSDIAVNDKVRSLTGLDFSAGGARLTGGVSQDAAGLLTGNLAVDAADISTAAALFLTEARGAINADITLEPRDGEQHATIDGGVRGLEMDAVTLQNADIQATAADLFGVPAIQGSLTAEGLEAAGIAVARLQATATSDGTDTAFDATAALVNGTNVATRGTVSPEQDGFRL